MKSVAVGLIVVVLLVGLLIWILSGAVAVSQTYSAEQPAGAGTFAERCIARNGVVLTTLNDSWWGNRTQVCLSRDALR